MNILLIDDEPFSLKLLQRQLRNAGFDRVFGFEYAREALAALQAEDARPDVIICDLQMPDLDGIEMLRHLAQAQFAGGLVLISGEDERVLQTAQRLAHAHQLHVLGALHKPVEPRRLTRLLEQHSSRVPSRNHNPRPSYDAGQVKRALQQNELINFYQPKVDVGRGTVSGVETLVRWLHPTDGLVGPDQFIATAEENGLIDALTKTVLQQALTQMKSWRETGMNFQVAVNISMDNLVNLEFPDWLADSARDAGVQASSLLLEVTESRLMRNRLLVLDILTRLRLKGISLSIDDFGTGFSSLAQLRDLPFDELKIDQSFVHGAWRDPSLRTFFDGSCNIGRQIGLKIVAEGVEDQSDWQFLREVDCDLAQGYFIARPMPAEQLPDWISDWSRHPN
ncbi:MAG: EAL domain-containing response regulator [Burkholderiaceae bacterium]|nr:EAL domain-containing response regulator [Roseateles sp.]MBV8470617.1 EAL domain-containing response regulator [Burkholderiaceae bacterium]